ncbi:MAG: methyl-accepting chemotaxis protein, partial [Gammaproteobacteria bacterium]
MRWFYNLRMAKKLLISFGLVCAIVIGMGIFSESKLEKINGVSTEMELNWLPSVRLTSDMNTNTSDLRIAELQHLLSLTPAEMAHWEKNMSEVLVTLAKNQAQYEPLISSDEQRRLYETFKQVWTAYMAEHEKILALSKQSKTDEAKTILRGDSQKKFDEASARLIELAALNVRGAQDASRQGDELYASSRIFIWVMVAVAVVLVVFLAAFLARLIGSQLKVLISKVETVAAGNLTVEIQQRTQDEIGELFGSFGKMVSSLRTIIGEVTGSTAQLASAAEEMSAVTEQTSQGVKQQQSETDQIATAMNEMSATVQDVARNAAAAAQAAHQADEQASNGKQVVTQTIEAIDALAGEVEKAAQVIQKLEGDSISIGAVLDVIKGIAEQTNLLALNAAIEAARAGEQGRGFAVVADEVRTLAQRTQQSTQEIRKMIESLQTGAKNAVQVMQGGKQQA